MQHHATAINQSLMQSNEDKVHCFRRVQTTQWVTQWLCSWCMKHKSWFMRTLTLTTNINTKQTVKPNQWHILCPNKI
jgi:hypothetical protein